MDKFFDALMHTKYALSESTDIIRIFVSQNFLLSFHITIWSMAVCDFCSLP